MTKRSLFLAVAAGLLASVAFATPSMAGSYIVGAAFNFVPSTTNGSEIDITLTGAPPASGYSVLSTGGLTGISVSGSGNVIKILFDPANATTPTSLPALEIKFAGSSGLGITTYGITGGNTASGYSSSGLNVSLAAVPEPTSLALLGIGMTGFLAFRRMFKRTSAA